MKENTASNIIHLPVRSSVEKFIKLDPRFFPLCKYHHTPVFMSYLIGLNDYWYRVTGGKYFYCTRRQQIKNIGLSRFKLEKAERECLEKGWIKKKKMGVHDKTHYLIVFERIKAAFEGRDKKAIPPRHPRNPDFVTQTRKVLCHTDSQSLLKR